MPYRFLRVPLWCSVIVLAACATEPVAPAGDAGIVAPADGATSEADAAIGEDAAVVTPPCATTPTYVELRDTIFTQNCATGRCHGGTTGPGRAEGPGNFTATSTRDTWVGRASEAHTGRGLVIVVAGDPDASFLMRKLTNDLSPDPRIEGEPMPEPGFLQPFEPLPDDQIESIRCWIAGGAP